MKKWVILVAVVLGGIFLLKSTRMASYGKVMFDKARVSWERNIPPEMEIDSLRSEIARMDNDIRKTLRPLAEKMVTIEQEEVAIKTREADLAQHREQLLRLRNDVASNTERVSYGRNVLTLNEAKAKLNREVSLFESRKSTLESRKRRLDALRTSVSATQLQLDHLMEQKRNFSEQLDQIVADLEVQKLNEIAKPLPVDNNKVSSIQERLRNLRKNLSVRQRERDLVGQWEAKLNPDAQTAPTVVAPPVDLNRIDNILGVQNPEESKVAAGSAP